MQRYIRLTYLIPELLNKLDTGEMALSIGVELYYLDEQRQAKRLAGLLYCPDCGAKLHFCAAKSLKPNQEFYRCANYNSGRGTCNIHYIRNVVLEEIVLKAVSSLADYMRCYEPVFLYFLAMQNNTEHQINLKVLRQSIDKGEQRIRQIDKAIKGLFEANLCGKITDERFIKMTASYEKEQKNLTASVENWKLELKTLSSRR